MQFRLNTSVAINVNLVPLTPNVSVKKHFSFATDDIFLGVEPVTPEIWTTTLTAVLAQRLE